MSLPQQEEPGGNRAYRENLSQAQSEGKTKKSEGADIALTTNSCPKYKFFLQDFDMSA